LLATARGIVAVLDACVLLPASLRDTLLRLAETPRLYMPKWSNQIWAEVTRNLESRRKLSPEKIAHLTEQVRLHFPEAQVEGYEKLTALMTNDLKDRHVVAAAVKAHAQVIVTSNLKDFPPSSLAEWEIEARHPDQFLMDLYAVDPETVASRLRDQAATIGRSLPDLLATMRLGVPNFAAMITSGKDGDL
jgi:predicted nucleic acid-binding protein